MEQQQQRGETPSIDFPAVLSILDRVQLMARAGAHVEGYTPEEVDDLVWQVRKHVLDAGWWPGKDS